MAVVSAREVLARAELERRRVERAARAFDVARVELDDAIVAGRHAGLTFRDLADATGLSPEWVRRIAAGTARARG